MGSWEPLAAVLSRHKKNVRQISSRLHMHHCECVVRYSDKTPTQGVDFSDKVPAPIDVSAEVEKKELEIARKERKPAAKSVEYFKIPHLKFSYQAEEIQGVSTFGGCKSKCDGGDLSIPMLNTVSYSIPRPCISLTIAKLLQRRKTVNHSRSMSIWGFACGLHRLSDSMHHGRSIQKSQQVSL